MKNYRQSIMMLITMARQEMKTLRVQCLDPNSTNAIVIFGVTITLALVGTVVVAVIVLVALGYLVYKLVQLIRGSGTTATPSIFNVIHDDAIIADGAGKVITASLHRKLDGNPLSNVDIDFEIVEGPITPGITSAIDGQTSARRTTNVDGECSVIIIGTAQGHDVCKVNLALGGKIFEVPYETKAP